MIALTAVARGNMSPVMSVNLMLGILLTNCITPDNLFTLVETIVDVRGMIIMRIMTVYIPYRAVCILLLWISVIRLVVFLPIWFNESINPQYLLPHFSIFLMDDCFRITPVIAISLYVSGCLIRLGEIKSND